MVSVAGRPWAVAPPPPVALRAALLDVHPVVLQVLYTRGLTTPEAVRRFLQGDGAERHDPRRLYGIDRATARIARAVREGERVAVHGDTDVDGTTATATLVEALREAAGGDGASILPVLPPRGTTGFGLVPSTVERLAAAGVTLVVTGDTGTRAEAAVERGRELGVDVVVTDHHLPGERLPEAVAVVNPHQPACGYPFKELAGVGVAWKLVEALALEGLLPPERAEGLLELVALGTVTDVSPLVGENRALVKRGLRHLAATRRPGLRRLIAQAGRDVDERLVGFTLGPRLNAAGRMGRPELALELLLTRDAVRATELAAELEGLNAERQRLTEGVLQEARERAAGQDGAPLLVLRGDGWPGGVIGLVAGRIADETGRPAFVVECGAETCRGSGRAGPGHDLVGLLSGCADLLLEFGGHAQAAGFAAPTAHLDEIADRLVRSATAGPPAVAPRPTADRQLEEGELDWALHEALRPLRPFGEGNPAPAFFTPGLAVLEARTVGGGGRHLRARVRVGREVLTAFGPDLGAVAGGIARRGRVDALYSLDSSVWNGYESLELRLLDVRPSP